jgi:predicted flavoprotein YhiN
MSDEQHDLQEDNGDERTQKENRQVAVIGAGAAGFFTAVNAARINPELNVTIFEKSRKLLSKVRISGGGRCNVTHHCFDPERLSTGLSAEA